MGSIDRQTAAAHAAQAKLNADREDFIAGVAARREASAIEELHATVPQLLELLTKVGLSDAEKFSIKGRFGIPRRRSGWRIYGNIGTPAYLLRDGMICQVTLAGDIVIYPIGHEEVPHVHALDGVHRLLAQYSQ